MSPVLHIMIIVPAVLLLLAGPCHPIKRKNRRLMVMKIGMEVMEAGWQIDDGVNPCILVKPMR